MACLTGSYVLSLEHRVSAVSSILPVNEFPFKVPVCDVPVVLSGVRQVLVAWTEIGWALLLSVVCGKLRASR
jgi:hypothetical protein